MRAFFTLAFAASLAGLAGFALAQTTAAQTAPSTTPAPPSAGSEAQTQRVGTFKQVEGEAWLGQGPDRRPASAGAGLQVADRITTGKTGAATVTLKDGTVLTVGPDSQLDLSQFEFDSTTQKGNLLITLLQGSVRVVTGVLAKINPDLFKISTPTSVVGVRGTDFIVETQAAR